jgi:hypothetical protein
VTKNIELFQKKTISLNLPYFGFGYVLGVTTKKNKNKKQIAKNLNAKIT